MRQKGRVLRLTLSAALWISGAAICASGQKKVTQRPGETSPGQTAPARGDAGQPPVAPSPGAARYSYEFTNPAFTVPRVRLSHDDTGRGTLVFERKSNDAEIKEPLTLSRDALRRVRAHWDALRFLDSEADYQSVRQYPHLGTYRLSMSSAGRERAASFNWSDDPDAWGLAGEYRRAADQAMLVFDIQVARDNRPLDAPKLLEQLDRMEARGDLSDPAQLIPLLRDLSTDERVPLIARNRAAKVLQRVEKAAKKQEEKKADDKEPAKESN
jgi:hypothetical protein